MSENPVAPFLDRVILGDVLEVLRQLPDECIDISVTSPPYNKGENKKGWLVTSVRYDGASDKRAEEEYQAWQVEVLDEIWRATKPGGSLFYNHKLRWEQGVLYHPYAWVSRSRWVVRQEIIWDRMIAANIRGWRFWQVDERIYWLYKPDPGQPLPRALIGRELKPRHALLTSIWRFPPEREQPHPAPFPLALPLRAIYAVLDDEKEKVVLDPFCGSGTTLVAAKILGHHYIGIDISPTYVRWAEERLERWERELPAAHEEMALHVVRKTFAERKREGAFTGRYGPRRIVPAGEDEDAPSQLALWEEDEEGPSQLTLW